MDNIFLHTLYAHIFFIVPVKIKSDCAEFDNGHTIAEHSTPVWDLVMRTGLWDRQGAHIASRYKEMYGLELFLR